MLKNAFALVFDPNFCVNARLQSTSFGMEELRFEKLTVYQKGLELVDDVIAIGRWCHEERLG